jgi:Ca-activated chloride channel family protein
MGMRLVILIAALSVLGDSARPHAQQASTFKSGVDAVYLDVTVMDRDGAIVRGLTANDFKVFDENVEHDVAIFSDAPQPISVGVLVDASRSMIGDRITAAIAAAAAVGRALQPQDLWSVAVFNYHWQSLIGWRPYDDTLLPQLKKIRVQGGTALFKSVADFSKRMQDTPHRKRAMLVITDGADDVVQMQRNQGRGGGGGIDGMPAIVDYSDKAVETLRSGEVLVYALGLDWPSGGSALSGLHVPSLRRLADPTGGAVAVASAIRDVELAAGRLADELRQQYTLGFYPQKAADGKYRRIKVGTKDPSHRVRTRAGYLATRPK